ncbi:adenine phosphoribosyltransferase [Aliarcobacter butzleri]|uniref:Adenine phosphoribosyltransferase n=1 Tax=Aliarcobacter butzleri TaxID=28197 RepID=A0AAP4PF64_9BACT|nr:adenine phosphoribosyltransferase [Aliarcobacter butzleri]MCP3650047.1 adenine phosphoribosyltransferase [Arcobacter sp. DNRA7]MCR1816220.1 adenine phosphoribosyltransferase [Aliarcobacter butzleri]MDN5062693.1 adenine phosphoribosyltransferase [Aliarcobacter butzleri]MDN5065616.1 adenine phosphoribosyltransferase [Aliarcobacter butzleri]MDN5076939.1 adenine phosphoribosyltransferase [Aliarcobacter butzleri]
MREKNVLDENSKNILLDSIRTINDYPKPGIIFKDITTLLNNKNAFNLLMDHLEERYKSYNLDYIAGVEARGFFFASALASRLKIGFVPVRKKGKLPSTTICEKYELEYGFSEVELHLDAFNNERNVNVLLIDDIIVSGGTAYAAANLIKKLNVNLVESCFLMNIAILDGAKKLSEISPVYCVLEI